MQLGTETGSLVNHMMSKRSAKPEIGMGATLLSWSDRHPATVIGWDEKRKIVTVQCDHYERIDSNGMSESQDYRYTKNPEGAIYQYRWSPKGWVGVIFSDETKRWRRYHGRGLTVGYRERYFDFSF